MKEPWYRKIFSPAQESVPDETPATVDHEDRDTQFGLGLKFASGHGAAQDYLQAIEWYLKAAAQNHALAQFNLGMMYEHGQGVLRDDVAAVKWIRQAAAQGDAAAQFNLGVRFQRAGVEALASDAGESRIEAYKWLHLAAAQGYHGSAAASERVALSMSREDVADGNQRVAAFVAEQSKLTQN